MESTGGLFHGRSVFSSKYITAVITDASHHLRFFPIKITLGDYFVVTIDQQTYVFKINGDRIFTYMEKGAKSFRVIFYDICNYMPVSPSDYKELEQVIDINKLPPMNRRLFNTLKFISRTEKDDFVEHDLVKYVEVLANNNKLKYSGEVASLLNYFTHLNITKIVTPLRRITDFLEEDLVATDARFMGMIFDKAVEVDKEHKPITNKAVTAKKSYILMIALVVIAILVIAVVYLAYESGAFENLGASFGGTFGGKGGPSSADLMKQYPTPESLKAGVDRGELDYEKLPADIKKAIDSVKLPVAIPAP